VRRGDFYRVANPSKRDPKRFRVFLVLSRQVVIDSKFSTVICAPVYSAGHGLSTQIPVGQEEGLLHESTVHCDELVSLPKSVLTRFVGTLSSSKLRDLDRALLTALAIDPSGLDD
jgi:mRNA interferase MazF